MRLYSTIAGGTSDARHTLQMQTTRSTSSASAALNRRVGGLLSRSGVYGGLRADPAAAHVGGRRMVGRRLATLGSGRLRSDLFRVGRSEEKQLDDVIGEGQHATSSG